MSRILHNSNNHHLDQEDSQQSISLDSSSTSSAAEDGTSQPQSLILILKVNGNKLENIIMDSAIQVIDGVPARALPAPALPAPESMEGTGKRKRKPTVKAVDHFDSFDEDEDDEEGDEEEIEEVEEDDEEDDAPAPSIPKASKLPLITKPRGARDIFIGVLSDFPEVRVHATKNSTGARARVFFQDVPAGHALQEYGVMSNGMVKITRVALDDALLTDEVVRAAGLDSSDVLTDRTPMMALVQAYHKIATAHLPGTDPNDDSNEEDVKDPKIRAARARDRVNQNRKRKSKSKANLEEAVGDEEVGAATPNRDPGSARKPTAILAGCLKDDPDVGVYVRISTHTNRSPYVFYTSKDAKGRLKYRDIKFLPEYKKANEELAKDYFRSILTPSTKNESHYSDGDDEDTMLMPSAKKRKSTHRLSDVQNLDDDGDSILQGSTQKRPYKRRISTKPVVPDDVIEQRFEEALGSDADEVEIEEPVVDKPKRKYKPKTPKPLVTDMVMDDVVSGEATPTLSAGPRSARARFSELVDTEGADQAFVNGSVHGHGFAGPSPQFQAVNSPAPAKTALPQPKVVPSQPQAQNGFVSPLPTPLPIHVTTQMPDPQFAINTFQAYAQQAQAYTSSLQSTIQKQTSDISSLTQTTKAQEKALSSANATIKSLESQIAALKLQTRPQPVVQPEEENIGGRVYTRDPADSLNPGLLRHEEDMEYDWGSKKWNRVITMRELDLVVDSEEDPVRYTIQDEDFQGSRLKDGSTVMVRAEGRFVAVGGGQFWERIVYRESFGEKK